MKQEITLNHTTSPQMLRDNQNGSFWQIWNFLYKSVQYHLAIENTSQFWFKTVFFI